MNELEALLRRIVREEVRAVVRAEVLPVLAGQTEPAACAAAASGAGDYLTAAEAAAVAGVKPDTVRAWVRRKELAGHRAGRLLRIQRGALEAFLARQTGGDAVRDDDERLRQLLDDSSR